MPTVLEGRGFERFAKASDEYVSEIISAQKRMAGKRLSASEKRQKLATILSDKQSGILRLGQSMIGPIQLKLRYQGISRNVLVEDALEPGVPIQYDVLDQWGQAYMLHGNEGEVKITPFEGKRVEVQLFRIASFPKVKKEDLYYLRSNVVEYAQDESKQAIMRQEDSRLVTLLEAAIAQYGKNNPGAAKDGATPNEIVTAAEHLTPDDFYTAVTSADMRQLDSSRLLMNPREYRDLYRWDVNTTGWAFKDSVVAGERIVNFGEFQVGKSILIPPGTTYLTPEPEFLGVMPVMYSLDVEENPQVEQFHVGWVMDELIGMVILNAAGIVAIRKSTEK